MLWAYYGCQNLVLRSVTNIALQTLVYTLKHRDWGLCLSGILFLVGGVAEGDPLLTSHSSPYYVIASDPGSAIA